MSLFPVSLPFKRSFISLQLKRGSSQTNYYKGILVTIKEYLVKKLEGIPTFELYIFSALSTLFRI